MNITLEYRTTEYKTITCTLTIETVSLILKTIESLIQHIDKESAILIYIDNELKYIYYVKDIVQIYDQDKTLQLTIGQDLMNTLNNIQVAEAYQELKRCIHAIDGLDDTAYFIKECGNNCYHVHKTFDMICERMEQCIDILWNDYICNKAIKHDMCIKDMLLDEIEHNQIFDTLSLSFNDIYYPMHCSISISFIMEVKHRLLDIDKHCSWGKRSLHFS